MPQSWKTVLQFTSTVARCVNLATDYATLKSPAHEANLADNTGTPGRTSSIV